MSYETITFERKDRIARITINRPGALNALNKKTIHELTDAFREVKGDDSLRVVVLTGAGERAFSTGHDIKEPLGELEDTRHLHVNIYDLLMAIWNLEKAVVCRVDGHCLGIGLDLALVCDIVIASENSMFGEPEIRFSSASEFPVLPWVAGMKQAKYLMLTGDSMPASEAQRAGLITKVVAKEMLDAEVDKLSRKLSNIASFALKINKRNINKAFEFMGFVQAMDLAMESVTILCKTQTEERQIFGRIKAEKGLKAALQWRDSLFE